MCNKQYIRQIIHLYGHLISKDSKVNNYEFSTLIKDNYTLLNPITYRAWKEVSETIDLRFKRGLDGYIQVIKI